MINQLLKENKFEEFCQLYPTLDMQAEYVDFTNADEKAICFAYFVLNYQMEEFNVEIINYLLKYNQDVIPFFELIKDKPCVTEQNPIKELLEQIIKTNNLELLKYLDNNRVCSLENFENKAFIVSVFMSESYQEGLNYYSSLPDFPLYVLASLQQKSKHSIEINWSNIADLLKVDNVDYLKDLIEESVKNEKQDWINLTKNIQKAMESNLNSGLRNKTMLAVIPKDSTSILSNTTSGIMPCFSGKSLYYQIPKRSHKKYSYDSKACEITSEIKSIWLNFSLQKNLDVKKETSKRKI